MDSKLKFDLSIIGLGYVGLPLGLHEDENLVVRLAPDLLKEPGELLLFLVFFADIDLTD